MSGRDFLPFAHLTTPNVELYRQVMGVFVVAKRRFTVHLRPEDVHESLPDAELGAVADALGQLKNWGNLRADPDTSRVTTVETSTAPGSSTSSPRRARRRSWRWRPSTRPSVVVALCKLWR